MTLFVASLFLPYTINFDSNESTPEDVSRQSTAPPSYQDARESRIVSVWTPGAAVTGLPSASIPKTPGATTNLETIFQPHVERPFNLMAPSPRGKGKQNPGANNSTSNLSTVSTHRNPHLMPLSDLYSPSEVKTPYWNQPLSRAKSPPPRDIRHYKAQLQDKHSSTPWRATRTTRERSRTSSSERKFNEENFTIQNARRGNGGLFNVINTVSDAGLLSEKTWVGTLGMPTDALQDHVKSTIAERLEDDYESLVVYISDGDADGHYEHFCKTILWPIFHYQIPDHPKSKAYEDHSWSYYVEVNQTFANRIIKNYKKGDKIWVHDYHLLLVPGMLREKLPDAEIGFFMHTAFPSSEVFRVLANRNEMIEGLLGANMVAFQTEEYGQHFLQTCSRILNIEANRDGVVLDDGRFVHVCNVPMGINPKSLDKMRALPEVNEWTTEIAERYAGKRIIVARDKLEGIRGLRQKMLAYELFLDRYPEYAKQTVLIQIATSASEGAELSATISDIVTRINSNHSTLAHQPVVFLRQDIDHSQYLALLSVAECLLITCLREGMNLTVHEYIYCQDGKFNNNKWSPLILSEFTGSASIFGDNPLLINPWDHGACAEAIKQALDMGTDERKTRWHNMYGRIMNQNGTQWYTSFMEHLKHAFEEHAVRDLTAVPRLSIPNLVSKYANAKQRLLILDYEGTLASWGAPNNIIASTPKRLTDTLNDLIDDPKNTLYVMSSRMPEELERLFSLVPGLGLIAENGAFMREAGIAASDEWLELANLDHVAKWKGGVKNILNYYVERVEGSKIDERHSAIIFDYQNADNSSSAFKSAAECANHINEACTSQHIQAVPIDNGICISDVDTNKSSATTMIGDNLRKRSEDKGMPMPDFLLVIGDSREDEYVFEWAHELERKDVIESVHTVTLGTRNTTASATLTQGVTGVISTLRKLAACSQD
ncbi:trehalose-phosphatase [Cyphellophora europaea CBS 101466]|uniref:Trehalose-phosphatase n=1 Tax=Cyphellophora europaea (strain CBS 101466) TaxID=1220924 RepID=W2RRL9_CYPE1|nr:trehalose-phosphatase [Cyphellophora europaea CBS 101466]ETN38358.1 trehalose-phosphatase [Cyphellophora europaea CBS 101466]